MKSYTIVLDGHLQVTGRLISQIGKSNVIVADGAIRYIEALHVKPELWVGDFDSTGSGLKLKYNTIEQRSFPVAKDKTDGELAIDFALERGAERIILCGALGGKRSDHAFFHFAHALAMKKKGIDVLLTSGNEEGYAILPGHYTFDFPVGTIFSLIGFDDLGGLTIEGARWPLFEKNVPFGSSLTLSNEVNGKLQLHLSTGRALLLATLPEV
ncbi:MULTISPECIES: thiamine diphosphokinase [Bartonella]|uniref:Thiamine diphosphokinase n=1 Tax=Bartonella choladocola TaxID=2750995 RepID=A0A1U9MKU3_9HYPH|nr:MULTISPECIES: thiamine diphosphokinase [Bartonella]AQT48358.1 thiamine diphosphokinase [Bartonella choladocola]MBH9975023.1 thiamine diphosphokinase [Bartonella choladocola]MBI0014629.1 thiamine diphosphokinase [Bartonella sp. B10834G3]